MAVGIDVACGTPKCRDQTENHLIKSIILISDKAMSYL